MTNRRIVGAVALAFALASGAALAPMAAVAQEKTVMVGGAAMYPSKDIVDNAANSKDHTTLVAAVKAAGLVDTLKGAGPFTVFAPTNAAFAALPAGTVDTLLKPENKATLTKVLTYHVVAGKVDAATLTGLIAKGGGKHAVKTVSGDTLTASVEGGKVTLTDAKGGKSVVTIADVTQKNGVIHVVDKVLLP
ncbi:MAG: fasciclin domain-containing protein [Rhodospirillales bacterium]|nr:MAG: fasciclin domain-containing protein [Rhodospirillales bacterium]